MPAPVGNTNANKGKRFALAIDAALGKRSRRDQVEALEALADKMIEMALEGDMTALREIADRIDGKPKQAIDVGGGDTPVQHRIIVDYSGKDTA